MRLLVENAPSPVRFSSVAQMLCREVPQLTHGWAEASILAAFLKRIDLGALQRAVRENGTTNVLYDPARHEAPTGVVTDKLVAGMLRAAELAEMRGSELAGLMVAVRPHIGTAEEFEIASVSRSVAEVMTVDGIRTSPRRVTAVLQAPIFGGLDRFSGRADGCHPFGLRTRDAHAA